jgi:hypothetical protein
MAKEATFSNRQNDIDCERPWSRKDRMRLGQIKRDGS